MVVADVLRIGAALASAGAGLIHLTAANAHREHALVAAFFVGLGLAQIVWAGAVIAKRHSKTLFELGGFATAAVIGVWIVSRTTGIPFVEGADHAEPIEIKDAVATLLEVFVVAVAVTLALRPRTLRLLIGGRSIVPLAAATALLIVPGIVLPAHHHADHSHIAGTEAAQLASASHEHADEVAPAAGTEATHKHAATAKVGATHAAHTTEVASAAPQTHAHAPGAAKAKKAPAPAAPPVKEVKGIAASVRYGPFVLPPAGLSGDAHYNRVLANVARPCTDCYLVYARPNLVYADGTSANLDTGAMLHHAVWTRPSINDATCGRRSAIGSQGERFFASGNERTEFVLPAGFGYVIGSDPWNLIVEVMNHAKDSKTVYISLDVKYRPLSDGLKKVAPIWMDIDNCGDSEYAIPAGKSQTAWDWTSKFTGRIVATGGHVHNGGVKTVLRNESTGKDVCTSVAGYGTKPAFVGTIESMSFCSWDRIGTVRKGQTLGIHAYYDSPQAQDDVMGIMMAFIYETSDLEGGTAWTGSAPKEQKPPGSHHH